MMMMMMMMAMAHFYIRSKVAFTPQNPALRLHKEGEKTIDYTKDSRFHRLPPRRGSLIKFSSEFPTDRPTELMSGGGRELCE